MDPDSWDKAKSKMNEEYKEIVKFVRDYEYSDIPTSIRTDEKIIEFFFKKIRESKDKFFGIIQLCYELHHDSTSDNYQRLRDDVDIFSDEVKSRYCQFKNLTQVFVEKLIKHDHDIVHALDKLVSDLDIVHQKIIKDQPVSINIPELRKDIARIAILFMEREVVCNMSQVSLEKTYERLQDEIREKI